MDINSIRHHKEKTYVTISMIAGAFIWLILFLITGGIGLILLGLIFAFFAWLTGMYFEAEIYGESVNVSENQYPEIHKIVSQQSEKLGITPPNIFIYNGNGMINAIATQYLSKRHIILMSDLVDLMLERKKIEELSMIIGHELGHHFAGHTNTWKNLLIKPSKFIPFLGSAYSRSCELTADRIGYLLTDNLKTAQNALVTIALGSKSLADFTNIDVFIQQERKIPELMGFIHKIYASHPRMTKRIIEITEYKK